MTRRVALVGNPNVGKSSIFNTLTGLRQHTGNWAGVTVSCASGRFSLDGTDFLAVDLPGIYSFDVRSQEEAAARDYLTQTHFDGLILVCDSTCLERGLFLLKQAAAIVTASAQGEEPPQFFLCLNLWDEAEKKGIHIDLDALETALGIPVIPCLGRTKSGVSRLKESLAAHCPAVPAGSPGSEKECACGQTQEILRLQNEVRRQTQGARTPQNKIRRLPRDFSPRDLAALTVRHTKPDYRKREERLDRIVTGSVSGGLLMCLLLFFILWLTIAGANYPSRLLWEAFFWLEPRLLLMLEGLHAPAWLSGPLIYGVYRVTAWIVSVMLPPMAIFFPLFTLLEDLGYLPRAAFNMDGMFHKCRACGKQCLTMAMGLGCNAAGVIGCRIIDSPRERLIAILTNSMMPCNGRFPLLLTMISLFFLGSTATAAPVSLLTALILTCFIAGAAAASLGASWLLSRTLLKGVPSSFTLELPPYRRPQAGRVIVRSIFDRTLFVLGRAVMAAAPAGLLIWLMANLRLGDESLLLHISGFLDPAAAMLGLDGVILMAFILGFPANEIVLPIILMAYLQTGHLTDLNEPAALAQILAENGWTLKTTVCMAVFSLFHWPCSTTCLTIKKETGSLKWTAAAFLIPTLTGVLLCLAVNMIWQLF